MGLMSAIKAIIKAINELYAAEKYADALRKCEEALEREDNNFLLHAMKGHCALGAKDASTAETAFVKASSFPTTDENQAQMQRVWKTLSELYRDRLEWSKYALAMRKLVSFALE